MTTTQRHDALRLAIVPRAGRIPSDMPLLNSVAPMAITAERLGRASHWSRAGRADHIRSLILDTLHAAQSAR